MRDIYELKTEINKLYNKGDNLNLLSVVSQNNDSDFFLPYTLYFELDNHFLSIVVATDVLEFRKFDTIEDLVKDMDLYYQSRVFIKKDEPAGNINKITPIINMYKTDIFFDLNNAIWNNDFMIVKKSSKNYFAVFLSEDFEETTPSKFLSYMTDKINEYSEDKINDFERLSILGYSMGQTNQIIKSKSLYDIEPLININTSEELMIKYNRVLKQMNPDDYDVFKKCVLLDSDFNFLVDKNFSKEQKDVIKEYLFRNLPYHDEITPEYNPEQIRAIFKIVKYKPQNLKYIKPTYSPQSLSLIAEKEFDYIANYINDSFNDEQIETYLSRLRNISKNDEALELAKNYISSEYNSEQISIIFDLISSPMEEEKINFIAKNGFNAEQMHTLMRSLEVLELEQLTWVTPEYTADEILEIARRIVKGQDYKKLLKDYKPLDQVIAEKINKIKQTFSKNDDLEK